MGISEFRLEYSRWVAVYRSKLSQVLLEPSLEALAQDGDARCSVAGVSGFSLEREPC